MPQSPPDPSSYLCDQGLVLRHELVQIFLVLVDAPQEVGPLVLQLGQLLVRLRERSGASCRGGDPPHGTPRRGSAAPPAQLSQPGGAAGGGEGMLRAFSPFIHPLRGPGALHQSDGVIWGLLLSNIPRGWDCAAALPHAPGSCSC